MGHKERFLLPRLSGRCGFESSPLLIMIRLCRLLGQTLNAQKAARHVKCCNQLILEGNS